MNTELISTQLMILKKPLDYLKIFFRRKWFIIIPTVIGLAVSIIACNTLPKMYEASTLVLVEEGRVVNPLIQGLAVSTSTAQRMAVLREQILGWDRINQLISALNLASGVRNQLQFESLVKQLRKNIIVRLRGNNIISISYAGKDPLGAQNIVKTITDIFIAENLRQQNKETDDAIAFINDQLALYKKKLKQAEISGFEDQLTKLKVDSTEKHPLVLELRNKIAKAKEEMESGNYEVDVNNLANSDTELKKMREELKQMREELATPSVESGDISINRAKYAASSNEKLYKLLLLERIDMVAARDTSVNEKLYNILLERLETAKITKRLESSKEGTRYTILDPARLPLKPISPNKGLVLFVGAFLGACLGTGFVVVVEMFDRSFLGVDEAKTYLELPILGAVSKIITQADVKAEGINRIRIAGISLIVGVVLIILIIFNVILSS